MYTLKQLAKILKPLKVFGSLEGASIDHLAIDSRQVGLSDKSLFFAFKTSKNDGHIYISQLIKAGVRAFVISDGSVLTRFESENTFFLVKDVLGALQLLAAYHRNRFDFQCIAITGSNGKTIVKEWLAHCMEQASSLVRSPKSYNSQIGVPLSLWQINQHHSIGLFEAGISRKGEMQRLRSMLLPTMGIFTNIGTAHSENFSSSTEQIREKLQLFVSENSRMDKSRSTFRHCEKLIFPADHPEILTLVSELSELQNVTKCSWGYSEKSTLRLLSVHPDYGGTYIYALYKKENKELWIPFEDNVSLHNALTVWLCLLELKWPEDTIVKRMADLPPVKMRMEIIRGLRGCLLINDSYNMDLQAVKSALNLLSEQSFSGIDSFVRQGFSKKTFIVSDIVQHVSPTDEKYRKLSQWSAHAGVHRVIAIGKEISKAKEFFPMDFFPFDTTEDFLSQWRKFDFKNEAILIKGARPFAFERIVARLEKTFHDTVYEVNMSALVHNLNYFRSLLTPGTKVMAMVKAFSYGSGSYEVANVLQQHKVDMLGVAYVDEGITLRQEGIHSPIMVMSPDMHSAAAMIEHQLEPEIYSFRTLESFICELKKQAVTEVYPIHIKIDTGMHRLGFSTEELQGLADVIKADNRLIVKSIFSHMVASEDPTQSEFSLQQIKVFKEASEQFSVNLGYYPCRHILNSAGILRFPEATFDMVRLGLGLYGVSPNEKAQQRLKTVGVLKTLISQIKTLKPGDSVGYGRKFHVTQPNTRVATLPVGYADGIDRRLGEGKAYVRINNSSAPILGAICMDMLMVDVTNIKAKEGDEAILFGDDPSLSKLAEICGTIPYELLTGISPRVRRVYYEE